MGEVGTAALVLKSPGTNTHTTHTKGTAPIAKQTMFNMGTVLPHCFPPMLARSFAFAAPLASVRKSEDKTVSVHGFLLQTWLSSSSRGRGGHHKAGTLH